MEDYLTTQHRVMSYELDSFGHVNNSVYLNYLEKARHDFMLQRGLSFDSFQLWGAFPVVRRAFLNFQAVLKADDEITIFGKITSRSKASFVMDYKIVRRSDGKIVFSGQTEHVFVQKSGTICRLPEEFCKAFNLD